jgi:hypothetical protein
MIGRIGNARGDLRKARGSSALRIDILNDKKLSFSPSKLAQILRNVS